MSQDLVRERAAHTITGFPGIPEAVQGFCSLCSERLTLMFEVSEVSRVLGPEQKVKAEITYSIVHLCGKEIPMPEVEWYVKP